jgi:hypothetical protein
MRVLFKPTTYIFLLLVAFASCRKDIKQSQEDPSVISSKKNNQGHSKHTDDYSSEVALKWMVLQLRIMQTTPLAIGPLNSTYMGYAGLALYESVVPGSQHYQSLAGQLNGLSALPTIMKGRKYNWPTSANAALATINRDLYTTTSVANKASIDSLENALNTAYKSEVSDATFQRSVNFGKAIGQAIYNWSLGDGTSIVYPPYVPLGVGYYEFYPSPSNVAVGPHWGSTRLFVTGSLDGSAPAWHPVYSTDPTSAYYLAEKEVYDVSLTLTPAQKATGLYYRDNPGFQGGGGHYLSILMEILQIENVNLEKSAISFAKMGISIADALVECWRVKYQYNIDRPIRYIREVMGHPGFTPLFGTPPHPDFLSGHSTAAGAAEIIFDDLFGANYHFTNHTYDYLGMPAQVYTSFADMAEQIGNARVLAGIHTHNACVIGRQVGNKVAQNIENKLKFSKKDHGDNNDENDDEED